MIDLKKIFLYIVTGLSLAACAGGRDSDPSYDIIFLQSKESADIVYAYNVSDDKTTELFSSIDKVLDVMKKDREWYLATDKNVSIYNDGEKIPYLIAKIPAQCDGRTDDKVSGVGNYKYSEFSCDFGFIGGKFIVRTNQNDITEKIYIKDGLRYLDNKSNIKRTVYELQNGAFVKISDKNDVPKFGWMEEFAFMAMDFDDSLDADYFSMTRKMRESRPWLFKYNGKKVPTWWATFGDDTPSAAAKTIKIDGEDIVIETSDYETKENFSFRMKDFRQTENLFGTSGGSAQFFIAPIANGRHYIMANVEWGDTPHIMNYFYILTPRADTWVKIEPPKQYNSEQLDVLMFSDNYALINANGGRWHLYDLAGKLIKVFEDGENKVEKSGFKWFNPSVKKMALIQS